MDFWANNPNVIFQNYDILPIDTMTSIEKMNSCTRFSILFGIISSIYFRNYHYLYISFVVMFITYLMYKTTIENFSNPRKCIQPTKNNPFMNPLVGDPVGSPNMPCDNPESNITHNDNIFRNLGEVWDTENSQRQFLTIPQGSPGRKEFMDWLYNTKYTANDN